MPADIVVLGGGVAGTLTANLLSKKLSTDEARIRLVDATGIHVYQPGWLYTALDRADSRWLSKDVRHLLRDDIELVIDRAVRIDPVARAVHLGRGDVLTYDYLVLATGAHLDRESVPGLVDGAHDFYSSTGALRLREALRQFDGGRIVVGVAGMPYKCPPAPVEFALLLDDYLRKRGIRDNSHIDFLSPLNRAFTIESASKLVAPIFERKGIELHTFVNVESVDVDKKQLTSLEGETFDYDLAVLIPPHRGASVLADSGLTDAGGWVPTNPVTLEAKGYSGLFAIGDSTDLPISKSGSTAHFEAPVVAEQIAADIQGRAPHPHKSRYKGKVTCFLEVGDGKATILVFDYDTPPNPPKPSRLWHAAKWAFNRAYWLTVPQGRV